MGLKVASEGICYFTAHFAMCECDYVLALN